MKRKTVFSEIQNTFDKDEQFEGNHLRFGFLGVLILIFTGTISAAATCWPLHNVILQPKYWYEPIFQIMITRLLPLAAKAIVEINLLIKMDYVLSWKSFILHFSILSIGHSMVFVAEYLVWLYALGYEPPMPFNGQIHLGLMYLLVIPVSIWFLFSSSVRNRNPSLKHQIISYIFLFKLRAAIGILYTKLPAVFLVRNARVEWGLIFLLPVLKKFNLWMHRKLVIKVTNGDKMISNINTLIAIGYMHSFSLTLLLGSRRIDFLTSCLIVVSDFGFNSWSLLMKILRSGQRSKLRYEQKHHSITYLALKELLEVLVPSVFCVSFVIAYYGPTAELIGNVKGNCWMFHTVQSPSKKLGKISVFIAIDLLRTISFGILLSYFCNQKLYEAYCYVVKYYGLLITLFGSTVINGVKIAIYETTLFKISNPISC